MNDTVAAPTRVVPRRAVPDRPTYASRAIVVVAVLISFGLALPATTAVFGPTAVHASRPLRAVSAVGPTRPAVPRGPGSPASGRTPRSTGSPVGGPRFSGFESYPSPPSAALVIAPDGALSNASAPISVNGDTYTLTGTLAVALWDERNGSTVNGAGHAIDLGAGAFASGGFVIAGAHAVDAGNLTVTNGTIVAINSAQVTLRSVADVNGSLTGKYGSIDVGTVVEASSNVSLIGSRITEDGGLSAGQLTGLLEDIITPPAGLTVQGSRNVTVTRDVVTAGGVDIHLYGSANLTLSGNTLTTVPGLACPTACSTVAEGVQAAEFAQLSASFDSISMPPFPDVSTATAQDIDLTDGVSVTLLEEYLETAPQVGVGLVDVSGATIVNLTAPEVDGTAVELQDAGNVTLSGLNATDTFAGAGGVASVDSSDVVVKNCSVTNSSSIALDAVGDTGDLLEGNDLAPGDPAVGQGIGLTNDTAIVVRQNLDGGWDGPRSVALNATEIADARLASNTFSDSTDGIEITDAQEVQVVGNDLEYGELAPTGADLRLTGCAGLNVTDNDFDFASFGIVASGGGDAVLLGNDFRITTGTAITWSDFYNVTVANNSFGNAHLAGSLVDGARYSIVGNDFAVPYISTPYSGFGLTRVADGLVSGNNLSDTGTGIEGNDLLNLTFSSNTDFNGGFPILVGQVTNVTVDDNLADNVSEGAEIDDADGANITDNSFGETILAGIEVLGGSEVAITANSLPDAGDLGISLDSVDGAVLGNNTVSGGEAGLDLENSSALTVVGNTIGGAERGFVLRAVTAASFVHNNFEDDLKWVITNGTSGLVWDDGDPIGGNYWSNATGTASHGILGTPFVIAGAGVDHDPLAQPWEAPTVVFDVKGLPGGASWGLTFQYGPPASGVTVLSSSGDSAVIAVPYAAFVPFAYRMDAEPGYVASASTGNGTTGPAIVTVTVTFTAYRVPLDFHALGLPNGTGWSLTLNGTALESGSAWINVTEVNGTYAYSARVLASGAPPPAGGVPSYVPPTPGAARIDGTALTIDLTFVEVVYDVTFTQVGLASNISWSVEIEGEKARSLTGPTLLLTLPNGTYHFSIVPVSGFTLSPSNGTLTIEGVPTAVAIDFLLNATPPPPPPASAGPDVTEYALAGAFIAAIVAAVAGWWVAIQRRRVASVEDQVSTDVGSPNDNSKAGDTYSAGEADSRLE